MRQIVITLVVGLFCTLFTECSSVPQKEIDDTKAVLDEAKAFSADIYCKSHYDSAQTLFNQGQALIIEQEKKLPFLRNFSDAVLLLAKSKSAATQAKNGVESGKVQLQADITSSISVTSISIDSVKPRIEVAQSNGMNVISWVKGIDSAKALLTEATDLMTKGELVRSRDKSAAAKSMVTSVKQDLDVMAPASGK